MMYYDNFYQILITSPLPAIIITITFIVVVVVRVAVANDQQGQIISSLSPSAFHFCRPHCI